MNSSVSTQKSKASAKTRGNQSVNSTRASSLLTTAPSASHSSFYAAGVTPGVAASVQLQVETEQEMEKKENEGSALQMMCSECAAEQEENDGQQTQAQLDDDLQAGSEAEPTTAVQMWSCGDYPEPTCAIQNKEENGKEATPSAESEQEEISATTPVQNKCAKCESEQTNDENDVQQKNDRTSSARQTSGSRRKTSILNQASDGLKNAHGSLPYQERIQTAFGHHDISEVRTEVGGSAARANERMGAQAYASGNKIGFRRTPSLHLAAHEAAHTVQQRAGLKLPGNMGTPGDPWERHADRVADAVVAGESAEALLDTVAPSPTRPKAHDNIGPARGAVAPANGNGIAPQVQGRITSGSAHQVEPDLAEEAAAGGGGAETGAAGEGGATSGAEESAEPEAVEETAEAAEENDSDPAADCALAEGDGDSEAEADASASDAGGGAGEAEGDAALGGASQKGRCYSATAEDPPEGSQEPANDSPPNESQAEAQVTYGAWEEADDSCECAAADAIAQETGGESSGESVLGSELAEPGATETLVSGGSEAGAEGETAPGEEVAASGGTTSEAGGGGGTTAAEPGDFSQNEATRDAAVAELDAATAEVAGVPGQALNLSRGLNFRGAVSGSAAQEAARAMALSQIRSFMLNATHQIEGAVSYVSTEVPARLGGMADSIIAGIDTSMAEQKSTISARIAGARITAAGEAASTREAIQQEYSTNVELVNAETDAAIEYLNSVYTSSTSNLALAEDSALGEVNQRFADGRTQHEDAGQEYADRAIATGQDWVASFDHCRAGSGNDNEYNGDDGFWDGCLTVRRAQAQQKAACSTASGFAKNMIDMGKKKGFELREQRTQYRCMLIAGAGQAQSTLDTTVERLVSGLESGRGGTLSGLAQVRDMNVSAVDAALAGTLSSLNRQEREQRQAVNDSGYIQQLAVEELAHQVAAGLARSVTSAMETLGQTLQQLREQLLEGDAPPPDVLQQALRSAEAGLSGGIGTLLDKMEEGAANAELQLIEAGANAASSLAEIASGNDSMTADVESGFSAQMSALVGAASNAMSQLSERQVSRAQESATQGGQTMEQVVSGFETTSQEVYTSVDGVITTSLSELDTELKNMEDGLDAKIAAEAWRAASKEQPAWKAVVAIVLIVLVIIASIVVTVLTLGAGAPLLAVVLVGAVVGAVTAGLIQIINNWAAGEEWDKGLVRAMVIGAVGGALGGAIGAGANGLAQAAVQGALRAGSSVFVQRAISVGINLAGDMLAEGGTQLFAYRFFGQKFNWQGFLMAGGMSVASTARGGFNSAGTPRSGGGASVSAPRVDVPAPSGGTSASVRGAMGDLGVGMGLAGGVELVDVLTGGSFDANRFFSSAASGAAGSRAAAHGNRGGGAPDSPTAGSPRTRSDGIGSRIADSSLGRAAGSARRRLGGMRDAAFARMEIPESSSASRRWESTTRSVEDWFAGGAGGMLGRGQGGDSLPRRPTSDSEEGLPGTRMPAGEDATSNPHIRPDSEDVRNIPTSELNDSTHQRFKVGDESHESFFNRRGGDINCDVCSVGCGNIIRKLDTMMGDLPVGPLKSALGRLKARVEKVEGAIEQASRSHRQVITESGEIAATLRALGETHPELGQALNNPRMFKDTYEPRAAGEKGPDHVRANNLGDPADLHVSSSTRQTVGVDKLDRLNIPADADIIYVVRDASGAVVKVGETDGNGYMARFDRYGLASRRLGLGLEIEINIVSIGNRGNLTPKQARKRLERILRDRLEGEGHVLPWDYDDPKGRLGREGPGVPWESPSGGSPLRDWEPGKPGTVKAGYLLPPTGGAKTRLVRGDSTTTPEGLADFLRANPRATKVAIAEHFGVGESSVRGWFKNPTWLDGLRRAGIDVSRWVN